MTHEHHTPEPTREDVIIGRIVDGEASPADWQDLDRIAEKDAAVWQRLARSQRAHARLERAVEDEIAVAELIELPLRGPHAVYHFVSRVRTYAGWAIAAVLALALITANNPLSQRSGSGLEAGLLSAATPDEAYNRYVEAGMEDGRVMSVMPPMLLDAQGLESGQSGDVVIVRRIMERVSVKDMPVYIVEPNEFGHPTLTPVEVRQKLATTPAGL